MFFFPVALEAIFYKGPSRSSWQSLPVQQRPDRSSKKTFSDYSCSSGEYLQKSDTLNAAVLEKALTIPQDPDDKDISLQVSCPAMGHESNQTFVFSM